jgi:isopentenyl-diphosphate delta-isomerase
MPAEHVVLVDADDRALGSMEKLRAHAEGRLHRAFSVFVFDRGGRLLLQRRAPVKYHSPGLWSNTCCGHPRPGEDVADAAARRLGEEMGFRTDLRPRFRFVYRAELPPGLVEHELDHVFAGAFEGEPRPDPSEVDAWRWIDLGELAREIAARPDAFTAWLRILMAEEAYRELLLSRS